VRFSFPALIPDKARGLVFPTYMAHLLGKKLTHPFPTQLVCVVLCRSDALAIMRFGAVKFPIGSGDIALVHTSADFQLPAYAIYKPVQAASDPAFEYPENSILHIASSSLEEAQQAVTP